MTEEIKFKTYPFGIDPYIKAEYVDKIITGILKAEEGTPPHINGVIIPPALFNVLFRSLLDLSAACERRDYYEYSSSEWSRISDNKNVAFINALIDGDITINKGSDKK